MTHQQFTYWLAGFLSALSDEIGSLEFKRIKQIEEVLVKVKNESNEICFYNTSG